VIDACTPALCMCACHRFPLDTVAHMFACCSPTDVSTYDPDDTIAPLPDLITESA